MSAHVNLNQFFEVDAYLVAQLKALTRGELPRGNLIECAAAAGSKSKREILRCDQCAGELLF